MGYITSNAGMGIGMSYLIYYLHYQQHTNLVTYNCHKPDDYMSLELKA